MKKTIGILLTSLMLLAGCSESEVPNVQAIDVLNQIYSISGLKPLSTTTIYTEDAANALLSIDSSDNYVLKSFISGAESAPLVNINTDAIIILQVGSDDDTDAIKKVMEYVKRRGICVIASDENTEIIVKDNFVAYISSHQNKEELVSAFNEANLKSYTYDSTTALGKTMNNLHALESEGIIINTILQADDTMGYFVDEADSEFYEANNNSTYIMNGDNYFSLIVETNTEPEKMKEVMQNVLQEGKFGFTTIDYENIDFIIDGNVITATYITD